MKKLHNFFKRQINNAGMSLVELLCAIAIMSIVGASVAGIMVVSANSYNRGAEDAELQQTAQLLANQINNLVQDAKDAKNPGGDPKQLEITKTNGTVINIAQSGTDVVYSIGGDSEIMAENVSTFECNVTDFASSGVVRMYICIAKDGNSFAGNYTATSRNIDINTTVVEGDLTMTYTPEYVLEPNQTYPLNAEMSDGSGIDWALSGNTDAATVFGFDASTGKKTITIGPDEKASSLTLTITSQTRRTSDGVTPRIEKTATVYIRRVTDVEITYENKSSSDGTIKSLDAGTVYRLTANATGTHLENKGPAMPDSGYDSYVEDGAPVTGLYTRISDKNITWKITFLHNGADATSSYIQILSQDTTNGLTNTPYVEFKLLQAIGDGDQLLAVATSTHSHGFVEDDLGNKTNTNITGYGYGDVMDYWWLYKSVYTYDDSNLSRGSDDSQGNFTALDILKNYVIPQRLTGENPSTDWNYYTNCHPVKYHRFREVTTNADGTVTYGPWTNWRLNKQNASDYDINVRPIVTQSLDCDKTYELQIRLEMVQNNTGEKLWPFSDTSKSEYTIDAIVKPISILFTSSDGIYKAIGAGERTVNPGQEISLKQDGATGIKSDLVNGKCVFYIERYNDKTDEWESVETSTDNNNNLKPVFLVTQADSVRFAINRKGSYRIKVSIKNIAYSYYVPANDWYTMAGDTKDYDYYDLDTGKGVFYFTAEENSDAWNARYVELDGEVRDAREWLVFDGKWYKTSEYMLIGGNIYKKSEYQEKYAGWPAKAYVSYDKGIILHTEDANVSNPQYTVYTFVIDGDKFTFTNTKNNNTVEINRSELWSTNKINQNWKTLIQQTAGWW